MQQTRLNRLLATASDRNLGWLQDSWPQRLLLILLSLFVGFFVASGIASTTGQIAIWDISATLAVVLVVELISRWFYAPRSIRADRPRRPLIVDLANAFKIGVTYGLFLEAFKLNS
ncbi:MAG: DUF565 domain-containing protein [Cyanobacteria bacterium P01_G01_bin.54]